ncbi:hypothetical protein BDV25DRAFT_109543 [Aspergillus avenaceus]|uniref:WD-like domain-containing protein n=1 Tax=Aspergillus avenaceus TaxID=36643 RepID=A0A5N6U739_ASPAV|nr:hypothetical protein BDV25DRAFT_109543 [Aspergillus avenaceus]
MLSSKLLLTAALSLLALPATASPVAAPGASDGLIVLATEQVEGGTLTWYGDASDSEAPTTNATVSIQACGSNDVTCYSSNRAGTGLCSSLIRQLNSPAPVNTSPRAVCFGQSGNQCCTSWSAASSNLYHWDLISAAQKIQNSCFDDFSGSGLARNVNLGGVCVTQCLSGRATGCN